jgi:Arc/MetJ family transcription regulator
MPCIHTKHYYRVYDMKRTNIILDDTLLTEGLKLTGLKTRRALVHHALVELVRRERQFGLLQLKGRVSWEGDLARMRKGRVP